MIRFVHIWPSRALQKQPKFSYCPPHVFWSASTRKVSMHVFKLAFPWLYNSWSVFQIWVCVGPLEGCLLVMDGRFILSSSLFLLSVFITQISPAHISRPLVHFPALLPLFNPTNSAHLNSVHTSGGLVAFHPERMKKHWGCIQRTREYIMSGTW